jgi:hypothetical protein
LTDVDGFWSTAAPGTGGTARKIIGWWSYTLTSANITTVGADVTSFKSKFYGNAWTPSQYVSLFLNGHWKNAIDAGKTTGQCDQSDVGSINHAISVSKTALSLFPLAQ